MCCTIRMCTTTVRSLTDGYAHRRCLILSLVVIALLVVVFALARQVGVLFERVAPMGALITDAGPKIGEASPRFELTTLAAAGGDRRARRRSTLLFFLSPTCPVCKKLLPVLKSLRAGGGKDGSTSCSPATASSRSTGLPRGRQLDDFPYVLSPDLGMTYRISRLPFAVLLDGQGMVRAKGLINTREQLESLFNAKEIGAASIQDYWIRRRRQPDAIN